MPPKRKAAQAASKSINAKKQKEEQEEEMSDEEVEDTLNDTHVETDEGNKLGLKWTNYGTLMALSSDQVKPSDKIIGFDMDSTLVEPKSGAKFPKNRNDWKWWNAKVPTKLKELKKDGFNIVIFTNQAGIEKNHQKPEDIQLKIIDLCVELGFPMQAFIAAATDNYRKPNTTMFDIFKEKYNGNIEPDTKVSLFVGDAAGRPKGWKSGAKKDFSCGDRTFAFNTGLTFQTPEEFFLGEKAHEHFEWDGIDPEEFLKKFEGKSEPDLKEVVGTSSGQEMIVMVGRPASGKSSFCKKHFVSKGYAHVNQDTLKTKEKCIKVAKEEVSNGKSVVIDNTCADKATRANYISIAKSAGIPVRCIWYDTDRELADHLNFYRVKMTDGAVRRIPDVAYNQFKSKFQEPTTAEGFASVQKMTWFPTFADDKARKLFLQRI